MKLLFCAAILCISTVLNSQSGDERILRQIKEVEWPKAYRDQDTTLLNSILADEFQMISADGQYSTKKDELSYIKTHKPDYSSFKFEIKRLEVFQNGTAIVAGTGTMRKKDDKGDYTLTYQSSNIFIKKNGNWKAIASHTSGDKINR